MSNFPKQRTKQRRSSTTQLAISYLNAISPYNAKHPNFGRKYYCACATKSLLLKPY